MQSNDLTVLDGVVQFPSQCMLPEMISKRLWRQYFTTGITFIPECNKKTILTIFCIYLYHKVCLSVCLYVLPSVRPSGCFECKAAEGSIFVSINNKDYSLPTKGALVHNQKA